jgi:hypothetical protein
MELPAIGQPTCPMEETAWIVVVVHINKVLTTGSTSSAGNITVSVLTFLQAFMIDDKTVWSSTTHEYLASVFDLNLKWLLENSPLIA